MLSIPAHAYELFPVAVLIGTLYVLVAPRQQLGVHRDARLRAVAGARGLGAGQDRPRPSSSLTFVHRRVGGAVRGGDGAEGQAARHELDDRPGPAVRACGSRTKASFINVREARQANQLVRRAHLRVRRRATACAAITSAQRAEYRGSGVWMLTGVGQHAASPPRGRAPRAERARMALGGQPRHARRADRAARAACRPGRCTSTSSTSPATSRRPSSYEIALWKKLFYPVRRAGDDGARAAVRATCRRAPAWSASRCSSASCSASSSTC